MNTAPSYGGCAQCHSEDAVPTTDLPLSDPKFATRIPKIALLSRDVCDYIDCDAFDAEQEARESTSE